MLLMKDMNLFLPAILFSASLYTICATHKEWGNCHFVDAFHCILFYVSQSSFRKTEATPGISNKEFIPGDWLHGWWINGEATQKLVMARGNSTLRAGRTRRGNGVAEVAEPESMTGLSSEVWVYRRSRCPVETMEEILLRAEMGNQMLFLSPLRD